jgi:hypothetical protein
MKNLIFLIITSFFSNNLFAQLIYECNIGADTYSSYAENLDITYQKLIPFKKKSDIELLFNEVKKNHENYLDRNSKMLYEEFKKRALVEGVISAETWRMVMQTSVDMAYIFATKNYQNEDLGKSKEYYRRTMYNFCIKNR